MPLTRRELLKCAAVAAGGLGLTAVGYEHLVPFIHQPDDINPGVSTWYATSCRECPAGCSMLVRNRETRAIKCEGNPVHPLNLGRLCARGQAALHGLYDPDRVKEPMQKGSDGFSNISWDEALKAVGDILKKRPRIVLMSTLETGSIDALMKAWIQAVGTGTLTYYEPINYETVKTAGGMGVVPHFDIGSSDYLISFSADFLETWISPIEYARAFGRMREVKDGTRGRFIYVGPRISMTAANADDRIIVRPGYEALVALAIASEMGGTGLPAGFSIDRAASEAGVDPSRIRRIASDLKRAAAPLALPGGDESTARAAMLLNQAAGSSLINFGRPQAVTNLATSRDMDSVISDMEHGQVDMLVIHGANPVYGYPDHKRFINALKRVPNIISMSSYIDETSTYAHWVLPSNTPLESWGDYSPYPDITNTMQPTMGTVFNTRQFGDTENYDKVLMTDDLNVPITETSILWIDALDTTKPHDYIVKKVAKSLNSVSIAVSKVSVSA